MKKFIAIAAALLLGGLLVINYNAPDKKSGPGPDYAAAPSPSGGRVSSTAITPEQSPIRMKGDPLGFLPIIPAPIYNGGGSAPADRTADRAADRNTDTTGNTGSTTGNTDTKTGNNNGTASQFEQEVLQLVNQARSTAGLNALEMDSALSNVAMAKAKDMHNNNYFDHNSPTYGSPFDMMRQFGISYRYAGENIAKGQSSAQQVMNDWMNSEGHRANILNGNYTRIGIAHYSGEWVQQFTG
ncbi:CAP domain-containing protein [Paenibacillus plantiphilus]|uniref:CAP domain-containing protein n=1 Tax=Paenibacillus plantiphilus TaxID=2905650 RepID=UPI001F456541|nr:CAP domain-containing protein [Paenibacillus plantiphilus]